MSMTLEFEPHSWYMGWAVKKGAFIWRAYTDNGNDYTIREAYGRTLKELKQNIKVDTLFMQLTREQQGKLMTLVCEQEYNPAHPDDTFNAGWYATFVTYDFDNKMELIQRAKA